MPDDPGDTRQRLDLVEQRLDAVETRINSEAGLRTMMDLDQATLTARLDAQDHLLRALAVTQSEHGAQLRKLSDNQTRMADAQAALAEEQTRIAGEQQRTTSTLGRVEAGVRTIIGLLDQDG